MSEGIEHISHLKWKSRKNLTLIVPHAGQTHRSALTFTLIQRLHGWVKKRDPSYEFKTCSLTGIYSFFNNTTQS